MCRFVCVYLRVFIQMRKTRSPARAESRVRPKARQRRRPARSSAEHPAKRRSFHTGSSNSCRRVQRVQRFGRDFGRVVGVRAPAAGHRALRKGRADERGHQQGGKGQQRKKFLHVGFSFRSVVIWWGTSYRRLNGEKCSHYFEKNFAFMDKAEKRAPETTLFEKTKNTYQIRP